ncbi:hypothetical protein [Tessaracoccus antarcticus]|uniref:hypothetical protein n=1 Tax=Tessaracoccus antarcticus TaxID=2479848 RepID=UPI0018F3FA20|nr:hypothetical protein [Tessaracoccus antarcticus]
MDVLCVGAGDAGAPWVSLGVGEWLMAEPGAGMADVGGSGLSTALEHPDSTATLMSTPTLAVNIRDRGIVVVRFMGMGSYRVDPDPVWIRLLRR